jgi:hypothetical protein
MRKTRKTVKAVPMPASMNEEVSMSVGKISNGYLIRETRSNGNDYKSTETYSPTKPVLPASLGKAIGKK